MFMSYPYILYEVLLGHPNLMQVQWIPLLLLFFVKFLRELRWGDVLIVAVLLYLQLLSSTQYTVFLTIMLPLALMGYSLDERTRKKTLIAETNLILEEIKRLDIDKRYEDPLSEPEIIGMAIKKGIMDAPHLEGVSSACGKIKTMFFDGANMPVDDCGNMIGEAERLRRLGCQPSV